MTEEELKKHRLDSDAVVATLSDGSESIDIDIAAEQNPLPVPNSPETSSFNSQRIKSTGFKSAVGYAQVAFTATWSEEAEKTVRKWEENGTQLTYTVTNYFAAPVTFNNCRIHQTETAKVVPGDSNEKTFAFEVYFLDPLDKFKGTGA